nr:uncharacterized protein LOC117862479 isoform X3 [Setaria viridis]
MNTKGFGTTSQHKAYCGKHSAQQKEEDAQRFGPEELRSMKRMRIADYPRRSPRRSLTASPSPRTSSTSRNSRKALKTVLQSMGFGTKW